MILNNNYFQKLTPILFNYFISKKNYTYFNVIKYNNKNNLSIIQKNINTKIIFNTDLFYIKNMQILKTKITSSTYEIYRKFNYNYLNLNPFLLKIIDQYNTKFINNEISLYKTYPVLFYSNTNTPNHREILQTSFIRNFQQEPLPTSPKTKELTYLIQNKLKFQDIFKQYFVNILQKTIYCQYIIKNLNYIYQFPEKAQDISTGLQYIEYIFESKFTFYGPLLTNKCGILINTISQFYIKKQALVLVRTNLLSVEFQKNFKLQKNYEYLLSFFENTSSIVSGNIFLTTGEYSANTLCDSIFLNYLEYISSNFKTAKFSLFSSYNLILESIMVQYNSNGIFLPTIHFELIVKKMTSCVLIQERGNGILEKGTFFTLFHVHMTNSALVFHGYISIKFLPKILGITKSTLVSAGMLASISFQETLKLLLKNVLEAKVDWAVDLKAKIIATDLLPVGTGWYRSFNTL